MDRDDLRNRTKQFALRVIRLVSEMPKNHIGDVLGRQILKSGMSIGANYREALRASSRKHFVSILQISLREADETLYWLELLTDSQLIKPTMLADLTAECNAILKILSATVKSTKRNQRESKSNPKSANPKSPNNSGPKSPNPK